ncbi:MAG: sensor histidine kinase [Cyanobacteria bacterium P01_F01_bin.53]
MNNGMNERIGTATNLAGTAPSGSASAANTPAQPTVRQATAPSPSSVATLSPSIPKMLRYVEWVFLLMMVLRLVLLLLNTPLGFEMGLGDYKIVGILVMLAILSVFAPINRPVWQRRAYICVEIVCLLVSRAFSEWGLDLYLFLVLAKSCFLLSRRDVIFITISAGVAWQFSLAYYLSGKFSAPLAELREEFEASLAVPKQFLILDTIANSVTIYITVSSLIILLCLAILAERKSRQQAATLSQEVEALAGDLERTRIARDIHDSLGHTLTTLDVQLEVAQALHHKDPGHSLQALNRAKTLSSQSLQEVRRAVATMRHGNFNLPAALTSLIGELEQNHTGKKKHIKVETHIDLPHLPLQVSQQLFLIAKEGLANIHKHAQASRVKLWAHKTPKAITLGLSDNGIGFRPEASSKGFGLRGMRERVQLLEGQMTVHSREGKGTLIQVTIPQ